MERPYTLSCHCGNIRFEVDAELENVGECNCSTCRHFRNDVMEGANQSNPPANREAQPFDLRLARS